MVMKEIFQQFKTFINFPTDFVNSILHSQLIPNMAVLEPYRTQFYQPQLELDLTGSALETEGEDRF